MDPYIHAIVPPLPEQDLAHVLARTTGHWEELRGGRIFITGGTGFFGLWLLESFAHANVTLGLEARAVVLTRNPAGFAAKAPHLAKRGDISLVSGDVRNFVFPEGSFTHVIHAGTTSSAPVEPQEMFDTIVDGTRRVLRFASTAGARKFLFVSSGAVYGRQPPGLTHVPEDYSGAPDPLDPGSAYGEGKRAAELMCIIAAKQHHFEVKIARCFAFVGPHLPLDAHFAIGNFIRDALRGEAIRVGGDGTPFRSYLYAADLAVWLWTILFHGAAGRAYNVGSAEPVSIREVADGANAAMGSKAQVQVARIATPSDAPSRYVPSTERAHTELGLTTNIDLHEALKRTISWHQTAYRTN
jgi:dTDP-glucose 4,6-dehydratase